MMSGKAVKDSAAAVGILVVLGGLTALVAYCEAGCYEPARVPAYCTDEVAFTARLVACVDQSPTREMSRTCRKAVHERCGIVMTISDASVSP